MRLYKVGALFKLGLEDLTKNLSVFIYVLLPLMMAVLYSAMGYTGMFNFIMSVAMNLAALPVFLMGTIVAEEKEKNTLRTLILNDVKAMEVLVAKALICLLFVVIDNILIFFICEMDMSCFVLYQLVALLTAIGIVFFGAVVGLLAKNQMSASLYGMPFLIIFLAPAFVQAFESELAQNVCRVLITDAMIRIMEGIATGETGFADMWISYLVMAVWIAGGVVVFKIAYKKVGVDN